MIDYVVRKNGQSYLKELDDSKEKGFTKQQAMQYVYSQGNIFGHEKGLEIFRRITEEGGKIRIEEYDDEYYC